MTWVLAEERSSKKRRIAQTLNTDPSSLRSPAEQARPIERLREPVLVSGTRLEVYDLLNVCVSRASGLYDVKELVLSHGADDIAAYSGYEPLRVLVSIPEAWPLSASTVPTSITARVVAGPDLTPSDSPGGEPAQDPWDVRRFRVRQAARAFLREGE